MRLRGPARLEMVRLLAERDGLECHYCRCLLFESDATVEHVWPHSWQGRNEAWNLALACGPCNRAAEDRLVKCFCPGCSRALWIALWRFGWTQARTRGYRGRDAACLAHLLDLDARRLHQVPTQRQRANMGGSAPRGRSFPSEPIRG